MTAVLRSLLALETGWYAIVMAVHILSQHIIANTGLRFRAARVAY